MPSRQLGSDEKIRTSQSNGNDSIGEEPSRPYHAKEILAQLRIPRPCNASQNSPLLVATAGRLYSQPPVGKSNYQNRPESERLDIEINREPVVEIDIGSSYLTIFYAWHDVQLDPRAGAYSGILGPSKVDREVAKFWVNASFGNNSLLSRWTKDLAEEFEEEAIEKGPHLAGVDPNDYPMKMIRQKILQRHPLPERWGDKIRSRVRDYGDLTQEALTEQFYVETGVRPRLDFNSAWRPPDE